MFSWISWIFPPPATPFQSAAVAVGARDLCLPGAREQLLWWRLQSTCSTRLETAKSGESCHDLLSFPASVASEEFNGPAACSGLPSAFCLGCQNGTTAEVDGRNDGDRSSLAWSGLVIKLKSLRWLKGKFCLTSELTLLLWLLFWYFTIDC